MHTSIYTARTARTTHAATTHAHLDTATSDDLRALLTTDTMTGALTRDHGLTTVRPGQWLTLIDLDRFKLVNDTLGHAAGDDVLTTIASRLGSIGMVVRLGGDEFALVTDERPDDRRVATVTHTPIMLRDGTVTDLVGASWGATRVVDGDVDAALHRADAAMYALKRAGRAAVVEQAAPVQRRGRDPR